MSFGIFANSAASDFLLSDSMNPYYYRGVCAWYENTIGNSLPSVNGAFNWRVWHLDGVIYHRSRVGVISGYFKFPRFSDTDLIFIEPLHWDAGISVDSICVIESGARWQLNFSMKWDTSIIDLYETYEGAWPAHTFNGELWNKLCPVLPKVHVFSPLAAAGLPSSRHGLAIYNKNGQVKYDSSRNPLRIRDIISITYPEPTPYTMDRLTINTAAYGHAFCHRPMYCVSNVTQAVSQFWWSDSVTRKTWLGDLGPSVTTSWQFQIWGVYGGALTSRGNSAVGASWAIQGYGSQTQSSTSGSFFFGLIPTGSSQRADGGPPYTHINCNSTNMPVLVADVADYV